MEITPVNSIDSIPSSLFGVSVSTPASLTSTPTTSKLSTNSRCSTRSSGRSRKESTRSSITKYIDTLSKAEEEDIHGVLAEFNFGCNIPFATIESIYFKNFFKKLLPAYVTKLPGWKSLSTHMLDKVYEKCIETGRDNVKLESMLVIDGWKNSSNNSKTVVCMLHTSNNFQAFFNAWDLSEESETGEKLAGIIYETINLKKLIFNSNLCSGL